ncbi:hypothetical protein H4Q26_015606 [Puccinia striiformis f. sp. tritici PST-130]|nr:hypothetical protein H4Q26_015606 [Puccinia striiformis f. sp. tritici PST-130]
MLRYYSLIALVLLMASWEVSGDQLDGKTGDTPFGCHKNVDAACSDRLTDGKKQIHLGKLNQAFFLVVSDGNQFSKVTWAIRLSPGTRDYLCSGGTKPQCCDQGKYQEISTNPSHSVTIPSGDVPFCKADGQ